MTTYVQLKADAVDALSELQKAEVRLSRAKTFFGAEGLAEDRDECFRAYNHALWKVRNWGRKFVGVGL